MSLCHDASCEDWPDRFDYSSDSQTESCDGEQIQEGRFAMEYDHERTIMRSAETAHIQQQREIIDEDDVRDTTRNIVSFPVETDADVRSKDTYSRPKRRRSRTFIYQENVPIFV